MIVARVSDATKGWAETQAAINFNHLRHLLSHRRSLRVYRLRTATSVLNGCSSTQSANYATSGSNLVRLDSHITHLSHPGRVMDYASEHDSAAVSRRRPRPRRSTKAESKSHSDGSSTRSPAIMSAISSFPLQTFGQNSWGSHAAQVLLCVHGLLSSLQTRRRC